MRENAKTPLGCDAEEAKIMEDCTQVLPHQFAGLRFNQLRYRANATTTSIKCAVLAIVMAVVVSVVTVVCVAMVSASTKVTATLSLPLDPSIWQALSSAVLVVPVVNACVSCLVVSTVVIIAPPVV